MGQSRERSCAPLHISLVAIEKGAFWPPSTTVANFTDLLTYLSNRWNLDNCCHMHTIDLGIMKMKKYLQLDPHSQMIFSRVFVYSRIFRLGIVCVYVCVCVCVCLQKYICRKLFGNGILEDSFVGILSGIFPKRCVGQKKDNFEYVMFLIKTKWRHISTTRIKHGLHFFLENKFSVFKINIFAQSQIRERRWCVIVLSRLTRPLQAVIWTNFCYSGKQFSVLWNVLLSKFI